MTDLKTQISNKDKHLKTLQGEVDSLTEQLIKTREDSRAANQHTQSQVEGRLKERIAELEGEVAETKKLLRKRQDEIEEI